MTVCCANCESALQSETEGDTFYQGDTDEVVTVSEAVAVIFVIQRSPTQNCCMVNRMRLCPNCISVLAELYRFFMQFKKQSTGSSYIKHILTDANWTLHDVNCINNPVFSGSVKEEEEHEIDNSDEWIVPDVQVTQPEPDFIIKHSTAEISTRLRFRKARFATALDQVKKTKFKAPKRTSVIPNIILFKRSIRLAKSSCDPLNSTSSQPVSPEIGQSDMSKESSKTFECRQCVPPKGFKRIESLTTHERAYHVRDDGSQPDFKCPRCFLQLGGERPLRSHMKLEHQEVAKFYCVHCPKTFTQIRSMTEHVKVIHVGYSAEEKESNSCPVCEKVYPSKHRLKKHLQDLHNAREALQCDMCDKIFFVQYQFEMHRKIHCEEREGNDRICTLCDKTYTTHSGLREHVDTVHLRKNEFICDICGFKTNNKRYFRSHMDSHNTEYKYSCPTCPEMFKTRNALKKHKFAHLGRVAPVSLCPYCGKGFKDLASLTRHIQVLHRDIPEVASKAKSYPCPICGKEFKLRDYVTQHLRSKAHGGTGRHQNKGTRNSRKAKNNEVMVRSNEESALNASLQG